MNSRTIRNSIIWLALTAPFTALQKATAQTDTTEKSLTVSGYGETFYSYDFGKPGHHIRQPFLYSYNRHHTIAINLAMVKASYAAERVRGNIALMAGTYSNDNMAAEKDGLKNIYEANAGVKLSKKSNLWVDAGILPSHIGWESAIGKDCPTLTRSIAAENSPYFETGVRLSYTSGNGKWYLSGLVLNGWQRIERAHGNNTLAFGHQLTFKPSDNITLNSSSFIGNDKPDSTRQMRYFHNLYGQLLLSPHFSLTLGFDIGVEQRKAEHHGYNTWYTPVVIASWFNDRWNTGLRGEYFNDPAGVIIATNTAQGFKTWGYSLNIDRRISRQFVWRIEGRGFNSSDPVFLRGNLSSNNNFAITSALAFSF
ncbi:porin [Niabella drilacis]|uniref:Putative beta-barrel porin-2, OmpL-like. bbp2 n=1 Tax=Niabella drilacis (strain DSM 25811 / CCM 8410 / CCUG 62505 / LMG 26954 / E90) TaxID=1285928 RepID=A0A1G6J8L6_NIADE|nr:porin [Niabella drilacis]SDC14695.1 Putative beta-barrel porin-2, OmpL-like. bbp2 [Niabella drilacis]